MAQVVTVEGYQFNFDPAQVLAVSDHDLGTGEALTCVYGLTDGSVRIREDAEAFLSGIGVSGNFVKLTLPSDLPFWVNAKAVSVVRKPGAGEYVPKVRAVVTVGSLTLGVATDPADAVAEINAHGGNL
jgi:hypothetical protein